MLTVATLVVAETHGLVEAGVPEPVNWVVDVIHTASVPVIVGNGFTTTVIVPGIALTQRAALVVVVTLYEKLPLAVGVNVTD